MQDIGLSKPQIAVISALSGGANLTAAAAQAGVHRNTVNYWRRNLPPFQHAFADAQYDRAMFFRENAEQLVDLAFKTIHDFLTNLGTSGSVRLKAAILIIEMAATPPPAPPATANAPGVHKNAQSPEPATTPDTCEPAADSPSQAPPSVHKNAQTPIASPKVGRNTACPCGSGKRYKRCCLNQPVGAIPIAAAPWGRSSKVQHPAGVRFSPCSICVDRRSTAATGLSPFPATNWVRSAKTASPHSGFSYVFITSSGHRAAPLAARPNVSRPKKRGVAHLSNPQEFFIDVAVRRRSGRPTGAAAEDSPGR